MPLVSLAAPAYAKGPFRPLFNGRDLDGWTPVGDANWSVEGGVLATGLLGAAIGRFRPAGMARAMIAMAAAQVLVAAVAQAAGHFTWVLTAVFVALWLGSAWLYRDAARDQAAAVA